MDGSTGISSSKQNLNMPEGKSSESDCQADTMLCEIRTLTDLLLLKLSRTDSGLLLPPSTEKPEVESKIALATPPITITICKSQETHDAIMMEVTEVTTCL